MTDNEIVKSFLKYFSIREIVDRETFNRFGDNAIQFFDLRLLETMYILREELNKPITINNWAFGGSMQQRGLRTNLSPLVMSKMEQNKLYISAHLLGKAFDFNVKGMGAEKVREFIVDNKSLFPYPLRLERNLNGKPISWVHLDTNYNPKNPHIYLFDV